MALSINDTRYFAVSVALAEDIANGGTLVLDYPSGVTQDECLPDGTHYAETTLFYRLNATDDFTVSFGASNITVTNAFGKTWPAGMKMDFGFDLRGFNQDILGVGDGGTGSRTAAGAAAALRFDLRFDTRAAAEAGTTGAAQYIKVGPYLYIYSATGTALTTGDGRTWSPVAEGNTISVLHWAENTAPGTTDLTAAAQSAIQFANEHGVKVVGGGVGTPIAISDTLVLGSSSHWLIFDDLHLLAIGGVWPDDSDGYSKPMINADGTDWVGFENVLIDCGFVASGVFVANQEASYFGPSFLVQRWRARADDMSYGVRTKTKAGQLRGLPGATARQYKWGDAGFDFQGNRTGYGWKMETGDFSLTGCYGYYTKYPFHKSGFGSWALTDWHGFNGALNTVTDASKLYTTYIEDPSNGQITGIYSDNGTLFVNGDDLHVGNATLTINGGVNHENSSGSNDVGLRISTSIADNNLAGLTIADFIGRDGGAFAFETTGAGSFADPLKASINNVATKNGNLLTSLGYYLSWRGLVRLLTDKLEFFSSGLQFQFDFNKGLAINLDADNNTGSGAGNDLTVTVNGTTTTFVLRENEFELNNPVKINDDLIVDTDALFVDAANNRVGVNTASPVDSFHVSGSSRVTGVTYAESTIVNDGTFFSDSTNDATKEIIRVRDSAANNVGQLIASGFDGAGAKTTWTFQNTIEDVVFDVNGGLGIGETSPTAKLDVSEAAASKPPIKARATSASFVNSVLATSCGTLASSSYFFMTSYSSGGDLEFRIRGDGEVTADGSFTGGGADYAEYFEWADGNPSAEDRCGLSVVLDGDKIRPAKSGETPIGVISANPSVIGDGDIDRWKGKFLRDDYGKHILEDYDVLEWVEVVTEEVDGEKTSRDLPHSYPEDEIPEGLTPPKDATRKTLQRRMIDPAYDPAMPYIPRAERPEWSTVGLMGKLRLRKGQPVDPRWIKMRDVRADVEEWLVR
jgi:hypothetical protein